MDSEKDTTAKKLVEFVPFLELNNEEIIFPIKIQGQTAYVHMKQYAEHDMMVLMAARATRMAIGSDYTDIKDVGRAEVIAFFWEHFIKLSGPGIRKDSSPEEHKKFITDHPRFDIERTAVLGGYGGITFSDPEEGSLNLLDMQDTQQIRTRQDLYFPDQRMIATVHIDHNLKPESEKDMLDYKQATDTLRILQRTKESVRVVNYMTFKSVYGRLIDSVEGVKIDGAACTSENKDQWLDKIPFWHKEFVLNEYFKGAQIKNAL
jgi:hypothetical protein